jgi:hypothetical protein
MCYEISFLVLDSHIYHSSSLDSYYDIRQAWGLSTEGAQCEWTDDYAGVFLRVWSWNGDEHAHALRKLILERFPTRDDFVRWLLTQPTRRSDGTPTSFVLYRGKIMSADAAAERMVVDRRRRHYDIRWWVWPQFRAMRERVYMRRKLAACATWTLRRLAAEGLADELGERMRKASWGRQPDGTFVTRRATRIGGSSYTCALHLPGRGGIVATADQYGPATIIAETEARRLRAERRAESTAAHAEYVRLLDAAAERLMRGKALQYVPGYSGGYFTWGKAKLALGGVLRRVRGIIPPPLPDEYSAYRLYDDGPSPLAGIVGRGSPAALEAIGEY